MDYVRYSDAIETPQPDETAQIAEIVASMARVNLMVFDRHRHGVRDAHAKSHGVLKGQLVVEPGLAPELAQGLFASPATYDVIIRLSSAPGEIHSDKAPATLGFAIKVLGVAGERLLPDDANRSQDILLADAPIMPFGGVAGYLGAQGAIEHLDAAPDPIRTVALELARGAREALGVVGLHPKVLTMLTEPNRHILGTTFHSMAALRFGDHVAKLSVAPESPETLTLAGVEVSGGDSNLRDLVVEFFRKSGARYVLSAQLCADLAAMPVEDASVLWDEALSPHRPVARIIIPPQEAYSPARRVYADDQLSFTPWRGIAAHRPLGSLMRARKAAYEASSARRHMLNALARVEPMSIAELPD